MIHNIVGTIFIRICLVRKASTVKGSLSRIWVDHSYQVLLLLVQVPILIWRILLLVGVKWQLLQKFESWSSRIPGTICTITLTVLFKDKLI
jgi:hypothetical protein